MPVLRSVRSRRRSTASHREIRGRGPCRLAVLVAAYVAAVGISSCGRSEVATSGDSDRATDVPAARSTHARANTPGGAPATDDFGHPLPPRSGFRRIVALEPATTEILFAIGAGNRVVGRTRYDLYPDSARLVPAIGEGIRPSVEALLQVHPDLVVLYASDDNRPVAERLRALGIAVVGFRSDRIAGFARITTVLGRLTGDTAAARAVRDSVLGTLSRVERATRDLPRPSVLLPVWENPLYVIGGTSFMNELVRIAGGRNVYDSLAAPSPQVTFEDVVRRDPDIILVGPVGRERLLDSPRWGVLRAVREGRVLAYDTLVTGRPGVRLGEAAVSLARLLHPNVQAPPR